MPKKGRSGSHKAGEEGYKGFKNHRMSTSPKMGGTSGGRAGQEGSGGGKRGTRVTNFYKSLTKKGM